MTPRPPRNQIQVLSKTHKRMLRLLAAWERDYLPNVTDIARKLDIRYRATLSALQVLDREGWVELVRDERGRIRAVKLLARV